MRKKDRTSGATRVGIVSRPLTKWGIEAMRRGATTALPPLVKVRTPAACSHAARFCCVRIEPSNRAPKHQRADRAEVESRMTGGVDPLCHGQKQLLDRPKLLEKFLLSTQFVPSRDCGGVCLRRWTGFVRVPRFDRPNDTSPQVLVWGAKAKPPVILHVPAALL